MSPLWKCPEDPQTGSKWWRVPLGIFCDAGEIEMGPLPGVPRAPNSLPLVPSTMWAQRPSESKVRRKGRWEGGSREAVMIGVLGHRVLRHN